MSKKEITPEMVKGFVSNVGKKMAADVLAEVEDGNYTVPEGDNYRVVVMLRVNARVEHIVGTDEKGQPEVAASPDFFVQKGEVIIEADALK